MATDASELRPCPFCGHEKPFPPVDLDGQSTYVECVGCGVLGPDGKDEAEARRLWNTRAGEHQPLGMVNVLADKLARYTGRTVPEEIREAEKITREQSERRAT